MDNLKSVTYSSSLTDFTSVNPSFDKAILRICYPGTNQNKTAFTKENLEKAIPSIYNCPVVCNYNREIDDIGGHDIELVKKNDGEYALVNITDPVGVIPESAKVWFENVEGDGEETKEYLCSEVLLWKRQEAYEKIKENGITAQSMEIRINAADIIDGIMDIKDFEFTAFCLLGEGVTPCFENASLEMYSLEDFKSEFALMMEELKDSINSVAPSDEVDNKTFSKEGGKKDLDSETKKVVKEVQGAEIIEEFTSETEPITETVPKEVPVEDGAQFELTRNIVEELDNALQQVRDRNNYVRYWYIESDIEAGVVYAEDRSEGWKLYAMDFATSGDSIVIDFDSKRRMKWAIVEFDEGQDINPVAPLLTEVTASADFEQKYQETSDALEKASAELAELRRFKADVEAAGAQAEREEVLAKFSDLAGVEAFEELKNACVNYSTEELEEKCYAIRGRNASIAKFSLENKTPVIKVEKTDHEKTTEPYGGLFAKYGIEK